MIATIALQIVGAWRFAGFVDEPATARPRAPEPAPPAVSIPDEPAGPPLLPREPDPEPAPASASPVARAMPPVVATPPPPVAPVRYRLSDGCGQTWEHPDPAYLSAWVAARNGAGGGCRRPSTRP